MDLNTILLLIIAIFNAMTPALWWLVRRDMARLEVNTNSKMDALLSVTAAAEFAKGVIKGAKEEGARPDAGQLKK